MNALLIRNPGSRSGRGKRLWPYWESMLKRRGISFESRSTEGRGHAVELARAADPYDTVVAVGGDGTINEVIDGVMQSKRDDVRIGVLYSGTSPDFCRFHNIPVDPDAAIQTLLDGESKRVDVARIEYAGVDGRRILGHFGCSCNIGLGHAIAARANRLRGRIGDCAGTCMAAILSIAKMKPMALDLDIDGERQELSALNNLSILKNPQIASGLHLDLDLQPADGRLVVCGIHGRGRLSLLSLLPSFYTGTAAKRDDVFLRVCERLSVTAPHDQEIEFDGDPLGFLPAEIELLPRALDLIAPSISRPVAES